MSRERWIRALGRGLRIASIAAAVAASVVGSPFKEGVAHAQPADEEAAKKLFVDARGLFDRGEFEQALPKFQEALKASGSPNARLYVARTLRELGRLAEAHREMTITRTDATVQAQSEPKYEGTRDAAASELAILDQKVGVIIVAIADPPPGVTVTLNGSPVAEADLGSPIAVMPGEIDLVAIAPNQQDVRRQENIAAGQSTTIAISFEAEAEPAPIPQAVPDSAPKERGGEVRLAGIAVTGLGAASLVFAGVSFAVADGIYGDLETECVSGGCTQERFDADVDSGKTWDTLTNVGLIAGGILVVGGVTMIVVGGPDDASEGDQAQRRSPSPQVRASVGGNASGPTLQVVGSF